MIDFGIAQKAKAKNRAGLDIGANSVKVVEITESNGSGKALLTGIGLNTIQDASKRAAVEAVKSAVDGANIASKEFAISVSGSFVVVRFLSIPRMNEQELKSAVRFEAEKFIPFNINDCILDFQVLAKKEREGKIDILLVAAKKDYVMERIELVEESGFSVRLVDADTFALTNAFLKNFPVLDPEKTFALLDIGSKITNMSIIRGGVVRLVRDIAIGSNDLNVAIAKAFGVDMAAAESLKVSPGAKAQEVANSVKGVANNLLDELRLPLSYYENQYGKSVDEIYLSGGGAVFTGLEELFREILGLNPVLWDPLQFLDLSALAKSAEALTKTKNCFAVAVGLAVR
jgi:type IV pilus assembly protein PilM